MSSFVSGPPASGSGALNPLWAYQSHALLAAAASFSM
jgi:hypothetical protein